jgi:hypothetical protein
MDPRHPIRFRSGQAPVAPYQFFPREITILITRFTEAFYQKFIKFYSFHLQVLWYTTRFSEVFMYLVNLKILFGTIVLAVAVPSLVADTFPLSGPVVSGNKARVHRGQAAAPTNAPAAVKRAIWAANQLRSKPYRYGGGHGSFYDVAYDCSGTVSYVLGAAGLISSPMCSTEFRQYGQRGRGKWITVYARKGHTFAVIAGLRLDTTPYDNYTGRWAPRWQTAYRPPHTFESRHPVGL